MATPVVAFDRPNDTVQQVSGKDPDGRFILSVLARRTYDITPDGRCVPSVESTALVLDPEEDPDVPGLLLHDTDLVPFKPLTDVVVHGHAYGQGRTWCEAGVSIAGYDYLALVMGDRVCTVDSVGNRIVVSDPERFEKIPLDAAHAYGGHDAVAEEKHGDPYGDLFPHPEATPVDLEMVSFFRYPRNPVGKGYLTEVSRKAVEALHLPNLEDPWDRWHPERPAAGNVGQWLTMPVPRYTGWLDYGWFPRCAYFGMVPPFEPYDGEPVEAQRGYMLPGLLAMAEPPVHQLFRGVCGASPGLQLGPLRGDEQVVLHNLHPELEKQSFSLPGDVPEIWTDGRNGEFNKTVPALQSILLEPDLGKVSLIWRGSAEALRLYMEDELAEMPLYVGWAT